MPDRQSVLDPVLLRFRKSGSSVMLGAAFVFAPALLMLLLVVIGAIDHDRSTVLISSAFVATFGIFAAGLLFWQLRPGTLTATTLTLPRGMTGHAVIPLNEIDEVGMVYAASSGWFQYIWRTNGTAVRLPLLELQKYPPSPHAPVHEWQLIADTRQGRTCLAIGHAVKGVDQSRPTPNSAVRQAAKLRGVGFWGADPTAGVLPVGAQRSGRHRKKMSRRTVTFAALGLVVLTAVGIILIRTGWETRAQERPVAGWVTTTGTIVDVQASSGFRSDLYGPVISFTDSAGISHRFTAPKSSVYPPAVGTAAVVSYDPRNPALAHYVSDYSDLWHFQMFDGILMVSIVGLVLVTQGWLLMRRRRRITSTAALLGKPHPQDPPAALPS